MMIKLLEDAITNRNINEIDRVRVYCENEIRKRTKNVSRDFKIRRDNFCESNHITDAIRDAVLSGTNDRENSMVAAGW